MALNVSTRLLINRSGGLLIEVLGAVPVRKRLLERLLATVDGTHASQLRPSKCGVERACDLEKNFPESLIPLFEVKLNEKGRSS